MITIDDIKKIAVLGAGTMGPGIAQMFAIGGYETVMWTRSEETRERAKETLYKSLQTFVEVQLFTTNGGRNYSAATVSYYIWQRAFGNNQIGYACAVVLLFGALILAITIFQMRMSKRWVYEGE